jgi:hypothetical protein
LAFLPLIMHFVCCAERFRPRRQGCAAFGDCAGTGSKLRSTQAAPRLV